jgi:hypothetical protein
MSSFDPNKYKKIFEQRFGAGSFDAGLSEARKIGRLKTEASFAKKSYFEALKEAERQRKKAEREAQKKTYSDALSYWNDPENKKKLKKEGADRWANEIRNNPLLQEEIKRKGFKITDYINALYAAASDGKFRSEREYKQFAKNLQKEANNRNKERNNDIYAKYGLDKPKKKEVKKEEKSVLDRIKAFLGTEKEDSENKKKKEKKKHSFLDDILTPIKQWGKGVAYTLNPSDGKDFSDAFKEAVDIAKKTERSKVTKELNRAVTRTANSATLGALDEVYKKVRGEHASQFKDRDGGGAVADFAYDALGYLVPGAGAYKAVRGAGLGLKTGSKGLTKARQLAQEGALTGLGMSLAEVGIREGLNPDDYNAKDNSLHIGIGTGAGAVADPLLYGAGKLAKNYLIPMKEAPSLNGRTVTPLLETLEKLKPKASIADLNTPAYQMIKNNVYKQRFAPTEYRMPDGRIIKRDEADNLLKQTSGRLKDLQTKLDESMREFNEAVEQQYQYLKSSLNNRKGVQQGGLIRDELGNVIDRYGRISENPGWYQEFYQVNKRPPTDKDLRELAEKHVREGFIDEVGEIPPWKPKAVQEIDDQIESLMAELTEETAPAIQPIIEALEQEKTQILKGLDDIKSQYETTKQERAAIQQALNNPVTKENSELFKPIIQDDVISRIQQTLKPKQKLEYEAITPKQKLENEAITPKDEYAPMKRVDSIEEVNREPIDIENPQALIRQQIDTSGKREKQKWSLDRFMTAVIDDLRPLDKATRDLGGKNLEASKNPYIQARLARGVAGKAETFLRGGVYDETGKKVGKSLQEIIKPVEKDMDDFLSYITAKRALDYDAKGLKAGIKPKNVEGISDYQLADATIRQIEKEKPHFKQVQKELVQFSHRVLDELEKSGILSKESIEKIKKENPNYVPMFRVQEPRVRGFEPLYPKNRYANLGKAIHERTGSERPIINPIESIIKNTYLMLNMAERNKAGRSLLELIEKSGENMWGRVVKQDKGISLDDLTESLEKAQVELTDGKADAVDNLFKGEGNKVYVYKDGKKVELELQEDLYKAMLSLDAQKQNFFIKMLSVPTRMLRAGAVLSPDFGPVNIIRDQFSAFINSKYGFIPFVDMFRGLTNVLKKDDIYWKWKNSGGANSVLSSLDREYLQKDLRKMVKQSMGERIKDRLKHPIDTVLSPLRTMSEITEEATRVGEFKKGLKKGASLEEAAFASRDLIDFNRAGYLGRQYNQVTAFFNAAVQSMDKLARTFKENPVGATAKALVSITLPSIVAYMYNHDKEWYKEIPQRERDLYWHFQVGDQIFKIPKPFEAGILFGTTMERFLDYIRTNDPKAFKDLDKAVKDAFTPPWLPTAVAPWIEVYANKSIYFDSPIVPRREENLLPEDQYGPYQSEVGKLLGKVLDTSPRKVDHVIKGYTGGLGKYALSGIDWASQFAGNNRPQLPDRGLADMPIVNRFVVKNLEGNNQSVNDFYELMDQVRRERMSAKKNNTPYDDRLYKFLNQINRDISELQSAKRDILQDPEMDGKQKAEEIREIDDVITRLAKLGISGR